MDDFRRVDIKYVSGSAMLRNLVANLHLTKYRALVFESLDAMCDMNVDIVIEMLALIQTLPKLRFLGVSVTKEENRTRSTSATSSYIAKRVDCIRTHLGWRLVQMNHSGEPIGGVAPIIIRRSDRDSGTLVWTKDFESLSS